jgi:lipopolysaccharide transport system ATP-binding protein
MSTTPVIAFRNVTKSYPRHSGRQFFKTYLTNRLRQRRNRSYALRDVSFDLKRGESLAIIGPNGAGKSTLLSLVAGLLQPDSGSITVNGRVAALLELGSGFHGDLTGAENLRLNASLMGLSREETRRRFERIVEFAGAADFIDEPLRTYSSGMVMRLAFSVAAHVDADVVLIDEILAVGDQEFQSKCLKRIREMREEGRSLVCVSHVASLLEQLCDQAIWLAAGEVVKTGGCREVLQQYLGSSEVEPGIVAKLG